MVLVCPCGGPDRSRALEHVLIDAADHPSDHTADHASGGAAGRAPVAAPGSGAEALDHAAAAGPSTGGGPERVDRRGWLVLGVASLGGFATALDLSVMFVAFPDVRDDFSGTSTALLSWALTIYSIVVAALLIPCGRLADARGRRRTFLLGAAVFGGGSLLAGLAPGPLALIAARAVQAAGGALLVPAAMANLLQELPASRRGMAVGTFGAVGGLAAAAGPAIGAAVVEAGGWRWALLMNVPLSVLVLVGGWFLFHESARPETKLTDLLGSVLVMGTVGSLAFAIVEGPEVGWGAPSVLGAFAVALAGGVLVVWRSARHPEPVLDLDLFRFRTFRLSAVVAFLFSVAFFAMFFGVVLFLTDAWGEPTGRAGLYVTPILLTASVTSFLGGRVVDRLGHRRVMVPSALLFAVGALALALGAGAEPDLLLWVPAAVCMGLGVGGVFPSFQSGAVHDVPSDRYGVAAGTVQTMSRVGATVAVAVGVVLVGGFEAGDPVADFDPFFWVLAGLGLVSAAVSLGIDTRRSPVASGPVHPSPRD